MKCANCNVHYGDDERECPMCGAKAGKRSRAAAAYGATDAHTTQHENAQAQKSALQPQNSALPVRPRASADSRKKNGAGTWIVVVLVLLLMGAVPLMRIATQSINTLWESGGIRHDIAIPDIQSDGIFENESVMLDESILQGKTWTVAGADHDRLTIEVDSMDYYTLQWDRGTQHYEEGGRVWMWSETDSFYFSEAFSQERYDAFTLNLERDEILKSEGGLPEALQPNKTRDIYMVLYLEKEPQQNLTALPHGDALILWDEYGEGAPIFPDIPVGFVHLQVA